jgi:hypothetical protein
MNKYIVKTTCPTDAALTSSYFSGTITVHIRRAALIGIALGTTVVLATGCSSTGAGFNARLISPVPTYEQAANFDDDNWYQPSRSPGFDSDLLGS